ncbi:MAG TPA: hypothetical protein ENF55_06120 [Thermoprotei archaeon]|nr:hypothetical protein [Thermoprotei archaeon]
MIFIAPMERASHILRSYRVPDIGSTFHDREKELQKLLELENFKIYTILGPLGCGKTKFIEATAFYLKKTRGEIILTYIGYLRRGYNLYTRVFSTNKSIVKDFIKLHKKYHRLVSRSHEPVEGAELLGFVSPSSILKVVTKSRLFFKSRLKKRHLVVVDAIDEVLEERDLKAQIDRFQKSFREKYLSKVRRHGGSLKVVVITSRKVVPATETLLFWNLNKKDYFSLLEEIKCPLALEDAWKLCGGNTGLTLELVSSDWILEKIFEKYLKKLKSIIIDEALSIRKPVNNIIEELCKASNIDELKLTSMWKRYEKEYVIIDLKNTKKMSEISYEKWIGRELAWQKPVFMYCHEAILLKGLEAKTRDVIKLFNR